MAPTSYKILGTTDDHTACELCGRDDLKSTVALLDLETGQTVYFGSDCASRAMGWGATGSRVAKAAKLADRRAAVVVAAVERGADPKRAAEVAARMKAAQLEAYTAVAYVVAYAAVDA